MSDFERRFRAARAESYARWEGPARIAATVFLLAACFILLGLLA